MLTIRRDQIELFETLAMQRFEDEMIKELTDFYPALAKSAGPLGMLRFVEEGIRQGGRHGFTLRGPLRTFLQLAMLFGPGFAKDPQCPWAGETLRDAKDMDEMARAVLLFESFAAYDRRMGEDDHPPAEALRATLARVGVEPPPDGPELEDFLAREAEAIYPRKCAYLGNERLRKFFHGVRLAVGKGGPASPITLALAGRTAFLFGHGHADDPRLPWNAEPTDSAAPPPLNRQTFTAFLEGLLTPA